ncbi:MAG TPA: PH domain-containing protein [Candidatus Paceibacterota bacterium]|nr:PH domain-containing protein [Candidatus Paceibacterota bacterium]
MKHLDPKALWLFVLAFIPRFIFIIWILGAILSSFWITEEPQQVSWGPLTVALIIYILFVVGVSYVWARLTYKYYRYELAENGFKKESGVIYKKYVTIPYDRIQNVDIYRGIIDRLLGLSDLQIQTAGGGMMGGRGMRGMGSEGRLKGLSAVDAEKMRDELVERARQSKNSGL